MSATEALSTPTTAALSVSVTVAGVPFGVLMVSVLPSTLSIVPRRRCVCCAEAAVQVVPKEEAATAKISHVGYIEPPLGVSLGVKRPGGLHRRASKAKGPGLLALVRRSNQAGPIGSYSYSAGDSTLLSSPSRKNWVHELARVFSLASTDSTFLFGGGWLEYLTTKFFIHEANNDADTQQQIGLALLSRRTLDFFPAQPLAQEHRSKRNEQAVFYSKGAYVFMMLEYVIGEAAFDSVTAKLYRNFKYTPAALTTVSTAL